MLCQDAYERLVRGRCARGSVGPRQRDDEPGAFAVGGGDGDGAPVVLDDVVDNGQTETGTAGVAGTGLVKACEGLEDRRVVLGRHARLVVGDDEQAVLGVLPQLQRHGPGCVTFGVAGQIPDRPGQLFGVAEDTGRRDSADVDLYAAPLT